MRTAVPFSLSEPCGMLHYGYMMLHYLLHGTHKRLLRISCKFHMIYPYKLLGEVLEVHLDTLSFSRIFLETDFAVASFVLASSSSSDCSFARYIIMVITCTYYSISTMDHYKLFKFRRPPTGTTVTGSVHIQILFVQQKLHLLSEAYVDNSYFSSSVYLFLFATIIGTLQRGGRR